MICAILEREHLFDIRAAFLWKQRYDYLNCYYESLSISESRSSVFFYFPAHCHHQTTSLLAVWPSGSATGNHCLASLWPPASIHHQLRYRANVCPLKTNCATLWWKNHSHHSSESNINFKEILTELHTNQMVLVSVWNIWTHLWILRKIKPVVCFFL